MASDNQPRIVAWEDPPPIRRNKGSQWDKIAQQLRDNPGKWARIYIDAKNGGNMVYLITRGKLAAFHPPRSFIATIRTDKKGLEYVYAKYIGSTKEDLE